MRPFLNKTPYELQNGKTSKFSYFRVFGCNCFILNIDGNKRMEALINQADSLRDIYNIEAEKFDTIEKVDLLIMSRLESNALTYGKNLKVIGENRPNYYLESVIDYLTKIFTGETSVEDDNAKIKRANETKSENAKNTNTQMVFYG